ncbi:MAG TPA: Wzz/FepE/Etk N-terminal domain-containing protein [Steroidobacteraceae bacterium]
MGPHELFTILWARRRLIIIVAVVVALGSFTTSLFLPRSYEARAILAPVSASSSDGILASASSSPMSLGGIAQFMGLPLGAQARQAEAVALLESDVLTEKFIRDNDLLPVLYASSWDATGRRWKVNDPQKIPTLWRASQLFKKDIRTIKTDRRTGIVTLTIEWQDPRLAAAWANGLVKMANEYLRAQALADSERNIAYLNQEIAATNLVQTRQVIYSVLRTEISKQMLARGGEQYAFKVIDPALVPEKAAFPNHIVWLLVGMFLGLFASCFLVTLRAALV